MWILYGALLLAANPATSDWSRSFPPDATSSYLPAESHSVIVVPAGPASEDLAAADESLRRALLGGARATLVMDDAPIGSTAGLDDAAILKKCAEFPVTSIVILHVFAHPQQPTLAVATFYDKQGVATSALSSIRGVPLRPNDFTLVGRGVSRDAASAVLQVTGAGWALSKAYQSDLLEVAVLRRFASGEGPIAVVPVGPRSTSLDSAVSILKATLVRMKKFQVVDGPPAPADHDDSSIARGCADLKVDYVALVRIYPGPPGQPDNAVVMVHEPDGQVRGGLSAWATAAPSATPSKPRSGTAKASIPHAPDPLEEIERYQQKLFEKIAPSVAFISTEHAFGSGFFVDDGLILTNAHVVENRDHVEVVLVDGQHATGKVVERAPKDLDLALVEVPLSAPALQLVLRSDLAVGTWVGSIGHGMGGVWTFTTGMVSNIYPEGTDRPVFQTQIPLNPGNSGGPVFDRFGNVVGIVTAGIENSNSINFAIRSDVALNTFPRLSSRCACMTIKASAGTPIFVDGSLRGRGPTVLIPAEARTYHVFTAVGDKLIEKMVTFPDERSVDLQ